MPVSNEESKDSKQSTSQKVCVACQKPRGWLPMRTCRIEGENEDEFETDWVHNICAIMMPEAFQVQDIDTMTFSINKSKIKPNQAQLVPEICNRVGSDGSTLVAHRKKCSLCDGGKGMLVRCGKNYTLGKWVLQNGKKKSEKDVQTLDYVVCPEVMHPSCAAKNILIRQGFMHSTNTLTKPGRARNVTMLRVTQPIALSSENDKSKPGEKKLVNEDEEDVIPLLRKTEVSQRMYCSTPCYDSN